MRTLIASIALSLLTSTAVAKPRHVSPAKAAATAWMTACVHEHTSPVGGVSLREATKLCKAAQKRNKATAKAAAAIEACEQAVTDACVEECDDAEHGCDCTEDALADEFAVCTGHGPAAAKGGK